MSVFVSVSGRDRDQERERQKKPEEIEGKETERESDCAALRRSIIHQTPAASLFPPPLPPPGERERARNRERKRESNRERVRESRLQASGEETSRGGSTKGKKNPSLSSAASLRASYGQRGARRIGLAYFYTASLQNFPWLYCSAWSTGRATEPLSR